MDMTFVEEILDLQAQAADRKKVLARHLREHQIDRLWEAFVREARAEAGLLPHATDEYRVSGATYQMDVAEDALRFTGRDEDGWDVSYEIPLGFVFEETREAAKEAVRAAYVRRVETERARADAEAAAQRAAAEKQLADLAESLGKTVN